MPREYVEEEEVARSHTIRNGDTLEKIAKRYLGSAARASEIYELNRRLLSSPELLPIGAELELPTRKQQVRPRPEQRELRPSREASPSRLPALVPIPDA